MDHNESAFITSTDANQASLLALQYPLNILALRPLNNLHEVAHPLCPGRFCGFDSAAPARRGEHGAMGTMATARREINKKKRDNQRIFLACTGEDLCYFRIVSKGGLDRGGWRFGIIYFSVLILLDLGPFNIREWCFVLKSVKTFNAPIFNVHAVST